MRVGLVGRRTWSIGLDAEVSEHALSYSWHVWYYMREDGRVTAVTCVVGCLVLLGGGVFPRLLWRPFGNAVANSIHVLPLPLGPLPKQPKW